MMNKAKLFMLLHLLKLYRAHLTFRGDTRDQDDRYRQNADAVIRDIRMALYHGGFYRIGCKMIPDFDEAA